MAGVLSPDSLFFLWWKERVLLTDYLTGAQQKITDWLMKMTFLGEAETAVGSNIKARFCIMGFWQVTPFWPCDFLFNNRN